MFFYPKTLILSFQRRERKKKMYTPEQARMDLSIASGSLLGHIDGFAESLFYQRPANGGWSAAEIVEHLVILEQMITDIVYGPALPAGRVADEKIAEIQKVFGDRQRKLHAPPPIAPLGTPIAKRELSEKLRESRSLLFEATELTNLNELSTGYEHAFFGKLTRLEWIYFTIFHGDRHLHQLLQLEQQLSGHTAQVI
jgi:hypothetical protein